MSAAAIRSAGKAKSMEAVAARILALHYEGRSEERIAADMGVHRATVRIVIAERTPGEEIPVPAWVLPHHRGDYRIIAVDDGEEAAASWARNAKRSEQQVCASEARS